MATKDSQTSTKLDKTDLATTDSHMDPNVTQMFMKLDVTDLATMDSHMGPNATQMFGKLEKADQATMNSQIVTNVAQLLRNWMKKSGHILGLVPGMSNSFGFFPDLGSKCAKPILIEQMIVCIGKVISQNHFSKRDFIIVQITVASFPTV